MADDLKIDELLNLQLLPDWGKSAPAQNQYEHVSGDEGRRPDRPGKQGRGDGFRPRGAAGDRFSSPRRDSGDRRPPRRDRDGRGSSSGDSRPRRPMQGAPRRYESAPEQVAPAPAALANVDVTFLPIEGGIGTVARQVKGSFKAFPVFDIARLFLEKPERQEVRFTAKDDTVEFFQDTVSGLIFTKLSDLVAVVLKHRLEDYYTIHKIQTEGPKGNFTGVAKCKLGGELLGAPNHHAYQTRLKDLYLAKYSKKMPFDLFRTKIEIAKDEETLAKWRELESWKLEYQIKGQPDDAPRLGGLDEVEKHFRENVLPGILRKDRQITINGATARKLTDTGLKQTAFQAWESEVKFPIKFVNEIRPALVHAGLHIFKNRKNATVVNSAKPKFFDIDLATVSSNISHIIEAVRSQPGIKLKALVQLVPFTLPERNESLATAAGDYFDPFQGARPNPALASEATAYFTPQKPHPRQARALQSYHENAVLADLLWLVHEGYVVEFFDGSLEIGKKNPPQPQAPKKDAGGKSPSEDSPENSGEEKSPLTPSGQIAPSTEESPEAQAPVAGAAE
ncbi:hypothetical protein QPK87_30375 [Kamptonema cortianum]|nr:hypothetical protein [Kamptonema cortianum]